ncbi:uncharacterized protein LOC125679781 [Ostrea edulis]|uniref:uncharacterized protein LOC125679781 n=1 Tax=Ostrea edulis TaxID=37623 RepID=UPI0024AFB4D8|nr:uncharacterized protein LOC125679781 [Ostrea edulis]
MKFVGLFYVTVFPVIALAASNNKVVCEFDTKPLSCPTGTTIQIRTVNFGRTNAIVCKRDKHIDCYSTGRVTGNVARRCNGNDLCQVSADSGILGENPCPGIPKYLDILWDCNPLPTTTPPTTTTASTTTVSTTTAAANQNLGPDVCHENLVSGPRGVADSQITSSSTYSNSSSANYAPYRGRLYSPSLNYQNGTFLNGGWSAKVNDRYQYIQVQLNSQSVIRGVVTQGRNIDAISQCCNEHVTKYTVEYSVDGVNFESVKDSNGNTIEFNGNSDQESEVTHMFGCSIIAKYLRIRPVDWKNHITMRFEVLGCPTKSDPYGVCPQDWKERPGSDTCYLITTREAKTFNDARQICRLQQGDLLVVEDKAEAAWVKQELDQIKTTYFQNFLYQVWIGMSNAPRTDTQNYRWVTGAPHDINIVPWKKGMPDNYAKSEHCAEFVDSGLNDVSCTSPINYICEKKKYWSYPGPATTQTPPSKSNSPSGGGSGSSTSGISGSSSSGTSSSGITGSGTGTGISSGGTGSSGSGTGTGISAGGTGSSGSGTGTGISAGGTGSSGSGTGGISGSGTNNGGNPVTTPRTTLTTRRTITVTQSKTTRGPSGQPQFLAGCKVESDCIRIGIGYHQSCRGCNYVLKCLLSGPAVQQCPNGYVFDNNMRFCTTQSTTCY